MKDWKFGNLISCIVPALFYTFPHPTNCTTTGRILFPDTKNHPLRKPDPAELQFSFRHAQNTTPVLHDTHYFFNDPLFPPVRSQRRQSSRKQNLQVNHVKSTDGFGSSDTIEVNNNGVSFSEDEDKDLLETDEMIAEDIRLLNDSLTFLMSQRRITYGPDGTANLLPTPNFSFLPDIGPLRQLFQWGSKSVGSYAICHSCRVGLGYLLLQARTKATLESVSSKATFICKFFSIANEEVCSGLVNRFAPTMYFILTIRVDISAAMFCGIVLQAQGCASTNYLTDWNIDLSSSKGNMGHIRRPSIIPKRSFNSILFDEGTGSLPIGIDSKSLQTMKVLHLTDIHLDLDYRAGSNVKCDTELCCRTGDGAGSGENIAGYYGDYRKCDLPLNSLKNALEHISQTHPDIGLIYMTGDLVPHNIWSTSAKENGEIIHLASDLIRKYFPTTRLIPVLGNHDVHPLNLFSPPGTPVEFSTNYIYEIALKEWRDWIPEESYHTFLHGGFYTYQVTDGFKVIILNTNVCYTLNFWQVYEHRDPGGQLQWLVKELYKAEFLGEKVHILGHVPPSLDDCWSTWSRNFYKIINRFTSTVTAQFYGHTHYDEFQLYYHNEEKGRAINPLWIGASLTPFVNLNPGYKIFNVDGVRGYDSSWTVLDHETWIYDLNEANANPILSPRWFRLYRATEAYKIPNVLPHSLNEFVHRMSSDVNVFNDYYRNYQKGAEVSLKDECDTACRKRILCRIVTPHYNDQKECIKIQSEVDGIVLPRKIFQNKTQNMIGHFLGSHL